MNKSTGLICLSLITLFIAVDALLPGDCVRGNTQGYTATNLGTLSGPFSQARRINNAGQIVGEASVSVGGLMKTKARGRSC